MTPPPYVMPEIQELTPTEGAQLLEEMAQDSLNISFAEFTKRLTRGDYVGSEDFNINRLIMLTPFASN